MDADVLLIEAARSRMGLVDVWRDAHHERWIGPGVYDIHAVRVPSVGEMAALLEKAVEALGAERVWVVPDCGLKTRGYAEVEPALRNLVAAARRVRQEAAAGELLGAA
jgi:5-methyltetrahydropteroyltriglutamate--homocysteine methyltransferase